jgi:hypothetical protein
MAVNNTNNIINVLSDPQQQKQAKKSTGAQVLPQAGKQGSRIETVGGDVKVTLSAGGRAASAVKENVPAGNGNAQTVQRALGNQGIESARAIKAYENLNQTAANSTKTMQNPPQHTQKTINRISGAA